MIRKRLAKIALLSGATVSVAMMAGAMAAQAQTPLGRHYREGEKLVYRMKGDNDGRLYEIRASGTVKKDPAGHFFEEYAWSDLAFGGQAFALPPGSVEFRQNLSLDPAVPPSVPNLAVVHPGLIGPITDLLTYYADLWLAIRTGKLAKTGDHFYQERGVPASWADGNYVVLGEDSIDFDMTMGAVDQAAGTATVTVRHVPPAKPRVKLPAEWMKKPVADTPNNWVEIAKRGEKYVAAAGKETFDVVLVVSLADGKILSGSIYNPVQATERECTDAALTSCGEAHPRNILRKIELKLQP